MSINNTPVKARVNPLVLKNYVELYDLGLGLDRNDFIQLEVEGNVNGTGRLLNLVVVLQQLADQCLFVNATI